MEMHFVKPITFFLFCDKNENEGTENSASELYDLPLGDFSPEVKVLACGFQWP